MAQLINKRTQQVLAKEVISARGFFARLKGLMGKKDFPAKHTLWIAPCQGGIHTFFMHFPIDVIFVNRSLQVTSFFKNVPPWKIVYPLFCLKDFFQTHSVFEFKTPSLDLYHLQKGDPLYVGD